MDKILDQFNKLNDQARYGILAGVVILIIAIDVFFLVLPQYASIGKMDEQVKQLSADTERVKVDRQRIKQLRKNLKDSEAQWQNLSDKIRLLQEVPAILTDISSIANEFGVKIDELVPQKSQQESLKTASDNKYYALPIVMKAHSGYHNFGRFLNKLENENVCFIMKDFIVQNDLKDPATHLYSLTIKMILVDKH